MNRFTLHRPPEFTSTQRAAFNQRMAEYKHRQEEYDEADGGMAVITWGFVYVIGWAVVLATIFYFSSLYWRGADKLVGLG